MADVVELIAKLGLEVTGTPQLQKQIEAFQSEAAAIDKLKAKLVELEKQKPTPVVQKQIERTTTAINQQTAALTKQVVQQQLITRAANQELGIIQKLQDKLSDLNRARESQTTVQGIRQINNEIALLNDELKQLTATTGQDGGVSGKGLLSQLFGIGSTGVAGKQVLQGVLAGAGIGVGFSVLPALTASLVEYTSRLLDARRASFEVVEASSAINSALATQLDGFVNLNRALNNLFGSGSSGYAAALEQTNALGVIEGKVFEDRKRRFDSEQAQRENELSQLDEINGKYRELRQALVRYDQSRNLGALRDTIKDIGLSESDLIRINKTIDETFANLTRKQKERVRLSENDQLAAIGAESISRADRIQASIENARLAFTAQTNREIFELNKKLGIELAAERDKIATEDIARQEKTTSNINKFYDIQGKAATRALNIELEETRKKGILTAEIEAQYDEKFELLVKENEAKRIEALRLFNVQQLQEQQKLNEQLLAGELAGLNQRLQLLTGIELQGNIDLRNNVAEKELQVQQAYNAAAYDEQVRSYERRAQQMEAAGQTETAEYAATLDTLYKLFLAYNDKQQQAETAATVKRINNIKQGYADVVSEVTKQQAQLNASIAKGLSEDKLQASEARGGGLFGRDFKNRISDLRSSKAAEKASIDANIKLRTDAYETLQAAQKEFNKATTDEGRKAAKYQIRDAQTAIDNLEAAINNSQAKVNNNVRETTKLTVTAYTDAFTTIASQAVSFYNTMNEYRQQDLEREISARQERLSVALELAERGNTEALDIERNALREARAEQRKNALEQQAINSALQLSYALVAVAKAAAEGGVLSFATIAATIGALLTGYSTIRSANQASQTTGFAEGGFTGEGGKYQPAGVVHRGEFVFDAATTARHRPFFEAIHETGQIPVLKSPEYNSTITRTEFNELKGAMYSVRDAIEGKQIKVSQNIDRNGVAQAVTEYTKQQRRKYLP